MELTNTLAMVGASGYTVAVFITLLLTSVSNHLRPLRWSAIGFQNKLAIILSLILGVLGIVEVVQLQLEYAALPADGFHWQVRGTLWMAYRVLTILPLVTGIAAFAVRRSRRVASVLLISGVNLGWITAYLIRVFAGVIYTDARPSAWSFSVTDLLPNLVTIIAGLLILVISLLLANKRRAEEVKQMAG